MAGQLVTLHVPDALFSHIRKRAEQANRTVEAEVLDVLATVVPVGEELPADLGEAVSPLDLLDDEALWRAARNSFAAEATAELEQLHFKRQREGLSEAEAQRLAGLVRQYERAMLIRARATALLRQRGHDISDLLAAKRQTAYRFYYNCSTP
jgi:plasmid stability protein